MIYTLFVCKVGTCVLLDTQVSVVECSGFCFQAEDGIRDLVRSRGLGDVYKRQASPVCSPTRASIQTGKHPARLHLTIWHEAAKSPPCLLYTSDAADERSSVDLGGRRILKKKNEAASGRGRIL